MKRSKENYWVFLREELRDEFSADLETELALLPIRFLKSQNFQKHLDSFCAQFGLSEKDGKSELNVLFEYRYTLSLEKGEIFSVVDSAQLQELARRMCEILEIGSLFVIFDQRNWDETRANRAAYYPKLKLIRVLEFTVKRQMYWSWAHLFVHEMTHHFCHEKELDQWNPFTMSHGKNFRESFSKVYDAFKKASQELEIGIYKVPEKGEQK